MKGPVRLNLQEKKKKSVKGRRKSGGSNQEEKGAGKRARGTEKLSQKLPEKKSNGKA